MLINENRLNRIISESIDNILGNKYEIWYRGYDSKYGSNHTHLLWVTDDVSYAKGYGDRIEEIVIDSSKLHDASIYDIDEIIGYEMDCFDGLNKEEAEEVLSQGYNAYTFHANGGESYCMCLLDSSSIVRRRELSRNEYEEIEGY